MDLLTKAFNNKVVWITGASSGIGRALALELASAGAMLVLSARRENELQRVAETCIAAGMSPDHILVQAFDMLDDAGQDAAVTAVLNRFGQIDLLFNNAGVSQRSMCLETEIGVYRQILELDVLAQISLTKRVLPHMVKRGSGHLAVTSSLAGKVGVQLRTGYCAAKHAVIGFFDALRAEVSGHGLSVTCVIPGFIRTDLSRNALKGDGSTFNEMSEAIDSGMDPQVAARVIAVGLARRVPELPVGQGKEMILLKLKRFFPSLVYKIMAKTVAS